MANQLTLLPPNILLCTPSRNDGISYDTEMKLRIFGCELIQKAGIMLRLQAVTIASGQTILHRFYFRRSLKNFEIRRLAAAALYLACKLEEDPRRVRDMINVFHYFEQQEKASEEEPTEVLDVNSEAYERFRHDIVRSERYILRELGFMVSQTLVHPHRYILQYIHSLFKGMDAVEVRALSQLAWGYLNDSMRTTLCCEVQPAVIAVGSIYLAACALEVALPKETGWYELFDVAWKDVVKVCTSIQALYLLSEFSYESLIQGVNKLSETEKDDADDTALVARTEFSSPVAEIADISLSLQCDGQSATSLPAVSLVTVSSSQSVQDVVLDASTTSNNTSLVANSIPPATFTTTSLAVTSSATTSLAITSPATTSLAVTSLAVTSLAAASLATTSLATTSLAATTLTASSLTANSLTSISEPERVSRFSSSPYSNTASSDDRKERLPITKEMLQYESHQAGYFSVSSSTASIKNFSSTRMERSETRDHGHRRTTSFKFIEGRSTKSRLRESTENEKELSRRMYHSRRHIESHRRSRSREALPLKRKASTHSVSDRKSLSSDLRHYKSKETSTYRPSSSSHRSIAKGEMRHSRGEGKQGELSKCVPSRGSYSSSLTPATASVISTTVLPFPSRSLPSKPS